MSKYALEGNSIIEITKYNRAHFESEPFRHQMLSDEDCADIDKIHETTLKILYPSGRTPAQEIWDCIRPPYKIVKELKKDE